jgi:hypothetical protein
MKHEIITGDCLTVMQSMPENSVDLVLCSPPYEDARTYGIGFNLKGQDWVDWAVARYLECVRVSRGLVVWVVEGKTKDFRWTATPALLMADLHRAGVRLRKPPVYARVGIPGSGGPDWWRNDYEFCVCSSKGKLPWSDNTATGEPPKYGPGGEPSYRLADGTRVTAKVQTRRKPDGERKRDGLYKPPEKANPGNIIQCHGGGGHMGSQFAHQNEAPFPEKMADAFIRSFCPPGGTVLDCFGGSGTTAAVAKKTGRNSISIDVRDCENAGKTLIEKRLAEVVAKE